MPAISAPADIAAGYPRLVADIGGTNARFAWVGAAGAAPAHAQSFEVAAFAGPAEAAEVYLAAQQARLGAAYRRPLHAAMALATALSGDRVVFTNSAWAFSREALRVALGLDSLRLVNDFEALALSLPTLGPTQIEPVGPIAWRRLGAGAVPGTMMAVLGPGTGLGVAGVVRTALGWQALPGEGGHVTLAAADALEAEVIAAVRRRHAHVSAERLLSGLGLPTLHAALAEVLGTASPAFAATPPASQAAPVSAEAIVQAAAAGDAHAAQTLDLFCALLGGVAGNLALTLGARGGVFVGGGIVPRFAARLHVSAFRERFEAKGRFRDYLAAVPTALITDTQAALAGAAAALDP